MDCGAVSTVVSRRNMTMSTPITATLLTTKLYFLSPPIEFPRTNSLPYPGTLFSATRCTSTKIVSAIKAPTARNGSRSAKEAIIREFQNSSDLDTALFRYNFSHALLGYFAFCLPCTPPVRWIALMGFYSFCFACVHLNSRFVVGSSFRLHRLWNVYMVYDYISFESSNCLFV